ncbi:hypothetical protein [Spiroplasma endosymbiont of Aleiodes alternator]|uniref:hypothetical protein n=1 Tax=Spiroplasma endosymbiont of Aleiodes alternator TaxID=3139329 RepID=UPI003CCABCD4
MNTFLKVFLTQRLQFCVYFILDVHKLRPVNNIPVELIIVPIMNSLKYLLLLFWIGMFS